MAELTNIRERSAAANSQAAQTDTGCASNRLIRRPADATGAFGGQATRRRSGERRAR
jgi:hypothetical protein